MTANRSFKRLVRSRMEKTGESYTAARRSCCSGGDEPQRISLATSDETIRRAHRTRLGGVVRHPRRDGGARRVARESPAGSPSSEGLHPLAWNVQAVVGSYERGPPRPPGRRARGRLHRHRLEDGRGAGRAALRRRSSTPACASAGCPTATCASAPRSSRSSARFDWGDGATRVHVAFAAKGEAKSIGGAVARAARRRRRGRADEGVLARARRRRSRRCWSR